MQNIPITIFNETNPNRIYALSQKSKDTIIVIDKEKPLTYKLDARRLNSTEFPNELSMYDSKDKLTNFHEICLGTAFPEINLRPFLKIGASATLPTLNLKQSPLHLLSWKKNALEDDIQALIDFGAKLEEKDEHGDTPLQAACRRPELNLTLIKYFIENLKADTYTRNKGNETILHSVCVGKADLTVIKYILAKCPSLLLKTASEYNYTPFQLAIMNSECPPETIEFFVNYNKEMINEKNHMKDNLIHIACFYGKSLDTIKILHNKNPELINERTNRGGQRISALQMLFSSKESLKLETVKFLIDNTKEGVLPITKQVDLLATAASADNITLEVFDYLYTNYYDIQRIGVIGKNNQYLGMASVTKALQHPQYKDNFFKNTVELKSNLLYCFCKKDKPNLDCIAYLMEKGVVLKNTAYTLLKDKLEEPLKNDTIDKNELSALMKALRCNVDKNVNENSKADLFCFIEKSPSKIVKEILQEELYNISRSSRVYELMHF